MKIMILLCLIIRILSNPFANVLQKKLTSNFGSFIVNSVTYLGLLVLTIPFMVNINFIILPESVWVYGILGGLLGGLGNSALVKSLSLGDLSVLGPINAYKSIVAMVFAIFFLHEIPSLIGIFAVIMIIFGSYFVFDTTEEKFSISILKRKDIQYRFLALFLTALEAVMIKQVIILSDVITSFIFWCGFGFIFSCIFALIKKERFAIPNKRNISEFCGLILMFGLMQITTNYVFDNMKVSYALALFQLSSVISVIFGYKFFKERDVRKKMIGTIIMAVGAIIIILN